MNEQKPIPKLSFVVTVYNEKRTIEQAINDVKSLNVDKEIIVVDNFSTDGTRDILDSMDDGSITLVYQDKNYGFGKSIETGIKHAKGEFIFIQFADLEYDYTKCIDMLNLAEKEKYDAVFGSRLKTRLKNENIWNIIKERPTYLASVVSTFLINKWYNFNFTDIIGTKLYRTSSVRKIKIHTYSMGFEFEHVSRMCKAGFHIGEVNIDYNPRTSKEGKKIKFYHMLNAFFAMFKVKYFESVNKFYEK